MISGRKDYSDVNDVRLALKVYGRTVLALVMSVIVYVSLFFLFNAFSTRSIGYQLYEKVEGGNPVAIGEPYYYQEGEGPVPDIELEDNQTYVILRSELEGGMLLAFNGITQVFMLILLFSFPYLLMKDRGEKDRNLTRFEHKKANIWRGVKVGLIAAIPSAVVYLAAVSSPLWASNVTQILSVYRLANYPYTPLLEWLMPQKDGLTVLGGIGGLVIWALVPAVCGLAYQLGYRNVHIMERIIYKKK